ncbi:MAG TPA: phosphatase PAP2 family protein [Candidatus Desulfaltia sp.]|nr:phosphatase PAP2 family protein [Candidatus Desulfaltia sp.]
MSQSGMEIGSRRRAGLPAIGFLAFAIFVGAPARAAETKEEYKLDRAFLVRFGRDFQDVMRSPGRWDGRDFLTLTAVTGTGLLLFAFDQDIRSWAHDHRTSTTEKASSFLSFCGNGATLVGLTAAIYAAGEIGNDVALRKTALLSLESLATASMLAWTIKVITGRARPYTDESSRSFHPLAFKNSYWSLPSGHAVASFSVATAIAEQTESPLVDVLAYGLATLVGISRIHENKHWASDVFFGSALGYFVAKKVCDLNRRRDESGVILGLGCAGGRRALTLSIAF